MTLIVIYPTFRQRCIDISFYSPSKKKKIFYSNVTTWIKKKAKEETRDHNSERSLEFLLIYQMTLRVKSEKTGDAKILRPSRRRVYFVEDRQQNIMSNQVFSHFV